MSARRAGAVLVTLLLVGCGQSDLWDRYQAERELWQARRLVERIQVNPRLASRQDYEDAIAAFRGVVERFPLSEWATPQRLKSHRARDVATIAGDALIAIGRLEESRERIPEALDAYRQASTQLAALPAVQLKALLAEAAALERGGDSTSASSIFAEISRAFAPVDAESGEPVRAVLEAPLRVAADLRARGAEVAADSALDVAESRFVAEATRLAGRPAAPELWSGVARLRAASGRPERLDPALDALRRALAESPPRPMRANLVMAMADLCFAGGRPDSALAYAAWAVRGFDTETRAQAMMLTARVWETVDLDSAVVAYDRYIETFHSSGQTVMAARFRRAELLEQQGRWEQARAEFRGLATSSATDDLALQSLERIVSHHVKAGEAEMGRIEARRALETLDHLLTTVQDDETLLRIRQARARLLLEVENWEQAYAALQDLWSHYGHLAAGVRAGFRAAEVAEQELRDPERARHLYEQLATSSPSPIDQEMARRQLERLRHQRG